MRISTIGIDLAKNIFKFMRRQPAVRLFSTGLCTVVRFLLSLRGLSRVWLAWRLVPPAIIGRARFRSWAMMFE